MAEDQQIEETVRVSQSRLDRLLQVTGRMIVQQSRINMAREQFGAMSEDLEFEDKANHIIRDIDDIGAKNSAELLGIVQEIRQVEIRTLFNRFTRVVRDVARARDKKVELIIEGGETLVDKSTCEGLSDPLLHMIRNSCDHGLENPEGRADAGKSETGIVTLSARTEREGTIIDIMDDGKGLDVDRIKEKAVEKGLYTMAEIESMDRKEILNFIFLAGFSTAAKVTDLSGRGVGMDVVRTNIEAMGGTAQIKSSEPGKGTTIELWVPLISAVNIVSGFVVEVGNILYILPLSSVAAAVQVDADDVHPVQGGEILMYQGNAVPIVSISKYVGLNGREFGGDKKKTELVVVIRQKAELLALEVDAFLGSQQVVLDDLNDSFSAWALRQGGGVSGTSLLGDGRIALVLEPKILFEMSNIPPEEWQQFLQSTFDVEQEADTKKTKSSAGDEMNAEEDEIVRVDLDIEETGRKRINMVPNIQTHLVGAYAKGQKILRIDLQLERDLMQADRKPNEVIEDLEKHGTVLSILPFGAQEVPDLENFEPAAFDMPFTIFMVVDANEIESMKTKTNLPADCISEVGIKVVKEKTASSGAPTGEAEKLGEIEGLSDFINESRDHLVSLSDMITKMESSPEDSATFDSVFRSFHSFKGMCGMMGFESLVDITHRTENLLTQYKEHHFDVAKTVDFLLEATQLFEAGLIEIEKGFKPRVAQEDYLERVEAFAAEFVTVEVGSGVGFQEVTVDTPVPLSGLARVAIEEGVANGLKAYEVLVQLEEDTPFKSPTVFLVLRELSEKGKVITTFPDMGLLEAEEFGFNFKLIVLNALDLSELGDEIFIPGIETVHVQDFGQSTVEIDEKTPIEVSSFDSMVIEEEIDSGGGAYDLYVELQPDIGVKYSAVIRLLRGLSKKGRVVKTVPSIDLLESDRFGSSFKLLFVGEQPPAEVGEGSIEGILSISVQKFVSESAA